MLMPVGLNPRGWMPRKLGTVAWRVKRDYPYTEPSRLSHTRMRVTIEYCVV